MKAAYLSTFLSCKHLISFGSDPVSTMQKLRECHGDFVVLKFGRKKIFFCFHPNLAQDVFGKNHSAFQKSRAVFDQIIPLTGKRGLVQLEGKEALTHRRLTVKAFSSVNITSYLPRFAENFTRFRINIHHELEKQSEINLAPLISKFVLCNALSMVIGKFDYNKVGDLLDDFIEINTHCGAEIRRKSSLSFFFRRSHLDQIKEVEKRLHDKIQKLISNANRNPHESLVSQLIAQNVEAEQIEHHVRTFLFAGFETTTTSILMALYLVAKNPQVKNQIQDQLRDAQLEDMETLRSQSFLLNAYKEGLRLYPPSWTLVREALQNTTIGDEVVKRGDQIFFGLGELHRHENFWRQPHDFLPERFEETSQHEFAFLPFGAGSRICIGMQTAYIEACYVMGRFLKEFDLHVAPDFSPTMCAQITSHPINGLPVQITRM